MEGVGSLVRRYRNGGWEVSERLYGAVGEKSIDFRKKLYRLFRKTLLTFPRQLRTNARTAWEQRFDRIGEPLRFHRTTAPPPR